MNIAASARAKVMEDDAKVAQLRETSAADVAAQGEITIGPRPVRPTVALTRLGNAFLAEGYPEAAGVFYREALQIAPNGASRARQGIARIALAQGKPAEGERYARESLQTGRFQAKTVAAWPLLIEARKQQSLPLLDPDLHAAMLVNCKGPLFARTSLIIINTLRGHGDPGWSEMAKAWMKHKTGIDPVIDIEIAKISLAEAKLAEPKPGVIALAGRQLLDSPLLSPSEAVGVAKTVALYSLRNGGAAGVIDEVLTKITGKFDAATTAKAVHAMALGAMMAKKHGIARSLLSNQISNLEKGSVQWGKGVWALARMESLLGNHADSGTLYLTVAGHAGTPVRFRVQGLLEWVDQTQRSGAAPDLEAVRRKLDPVLALAGDFRLLLDAGRQLTLAGDLFKEIAGVVIQKGVELSTAAFLNADEPRDALEILIVLARRQFYDFGQFRQLVALWERISPSKREWLWNPDARYWEYLSLVYRSYQSNDDDVSADRVAHTMLDDLGVPPLGIAYLATVYGESLVRRGRFADGMKQLGRAIETLPTHEATSTGYYWAALDARKKKDSAQMVIQASALRRCFGGKPGLDRQWALDARAVLLLAEAGVSRTSAEPARYTEDFMLTQTAAILADSELIP
jgi:tetratricopeptide (TPR) repeat protein